MNIFKKTLKTWNHNKLNENKKYFSRDQTKTKILTCATAFYGKNYHAAIIKLLEKKQELYIKLINFY